VHVINFLLLIIIITALLLLWCRCGISATVCKSHGLLTRPTYLLTYLLTSAVISWHCCV